MWHKQIFVIVSCLLFGMPTCDLVSCSVLVCWLPGVQCLLPVLLGFQEHSNEFLREKAHLRPRSNFIACVARVRSALAVATHEFFRTKGFQYVHTPLITAADCEGAGEMFQVTTLIQELHISDSHTIRGNQ